MPDSAKLIPFMVLYAGYSLSGIQVTTSWKTRLISNMTDKPVRAPNSLNAILYFLYYIPDVTDDPIISPELITQIKERYQKSTVANLCEGLDWALNNVDFDFSSELPNLLKTNDEIVIFLRKIKIIFAEHRICSK